MEINIPIFQCSTTFVSSWLYINEIKKEEIVQLPVDTLYLPIARPKHHRRESPTKDISAEAYFEWRRRQSWKPPKWYKQ